MKIGISARIGQKNGFGRYGNDTYKKLKQLGFDTADFNMSNTDDEIYTLPLEQADKLLLKEKALADEAGIKFSQVHGPWRYPPRDGTDEERAERFEKMQASIRKTALLGCKYWVIHPLMPFGMEERNTPQAELTRKINLQFFEELLKTAKEHDVIICLENMPMPNFSISTPEDILSIVNEINDANFKVCLDTGHVNVFKNLNIYDEVKRLGDKLKVLHVHDNILSLDIHLLPFFGTLDWKGFSSALKEIGFNGSFSIESAIPDKLPNHLFDEANTLLVKVINHIISDN